MNNKIKLKYPSPFYDLPSEQSYNAGKNFLDIYVFAKTQHVVKYIQNSKHVRPMITHTKEREEIHGVRLEFEICLPLHGPI